MRSGDVPNRMMFPYFFSFGIAYRHVPNGHDGSDEEHCEGDAHVQVIEKESRYSVYKGNEEEGDLVPFTALALLGLGQQKVGEGRDELPSAQTEIKSSEAVPQVEESEEEACKKDHCLDPEITFYQRFHMLICFVVSEINESLG